MLVGLRKKYLASLKDGFESNVVYRVEQRAMDMSTAAHQWINYWEVILRSITPELDNVTIHSGGGDIKVNRIFSSEPGSYFYELADFYVRSIFPEHSVWFKSQTRAVQTGRLIDSSDLSVASKRFQGDLLDVARHLMSEGGFYDAAVEALLHFSMLGTAPLFMNQSVEGVSFQHIPIQTAPILLSADKGEVIGFARVVEMDEWEIRREYGAEGLLLFSKPSKDPYRAAMHDPTTAGYIPRYGQGSTFLPGPANGSQGAGVRTNAKRVLRLYIPNKEYMGVPGAGTFMPEMEFICYVVTQETKRLLDVEIFPSKPFGVAADIRVSGELYSRGLGGRLLPDIGVLNKKKQAELVVDSLVAQSPLVVTGRGFQRPIGQSLRPFQMLHLKDGTKLEPLYNNNSLYQRTRSIYESELETLRMGMRKDKMDVAQADRMTAQEFLQRQDSSWGIFQPQGNRVFRGMALPILRAVFNYAIQRGMVSAPPDQLVDGTLSMEVAPVSAFAHGQPSERGQNLARALAPMAGFIEKDPTLLDGFNRTKFLAATLGDHELSEFVSTEEEIQKERQRRVEEAQAMRGGGQQRPGPEQMAQDQAMQAQMQNDVAGERILEYAGLI